MTQFGLTHATSTKTPIEFYQPTVKLAEEEDWLSYTDPPVMSS